MLVNGVVGKEAAMGKRVYSDIAKFKTVEEALRRATNDFRDAIECIDAALTKRR